MPNSKITDEALAEIPSGLGELRDRVGNLEFRLDNLESGLAENTASTRRVETNTSDLVEAFDSLKGAFKVFNWIGKAAKPIGYIAAACAACLSLWTAFKAGVGFK